LNKVLVYDSVLGRLLHLQRKVKLKVTLQQATKAQRGSRGLAILYFNLSARWGGWSTPRPGRFTPRKDPVPGV
jgi:hypothetical protein